MRRRGGGPRTRGARRRACRRARSGTVRDRCVSSAASHVHAELVAVVTVVVVVVVVVVIVVVMAAFAVVVFVVFWFAAVDTERVRERLYRAPQRCLRIGVHSAEHARARRSHLLDACASGRRDRSEQCLQEECEAGGAPSVLTRLSERRLRLRTAGERAQRARSEHVLARGWPLDACTHDRQPVLGAMEQGDEAFERVEGQAHTLDALRPTLKLC